MRARTVRCLLLLLVLPIEAARGSQITLETDYGAEGGYPTLWYGLAPANGYFAALGLRMDGESVEPEISGRVTFNSGPLLSLVVQPGADEYVPDVSTYRYGPGRFTMDVTWMTDRGAPRRARFVAPLLALEVVACEGCDVGDMSYGAFTATLGAGRFERRLAAVLGITGLSPTGAFSGHLDQISGTPATDTRFAGALAPWEVAVEVTRGAPALPAPAAAPLLAAGALAAAYRRVRRRL